MSPSENLRWRYCICLYIVWEELGFLVCGVLGVFSDGWRLESSWLENLQQWVSRVCAAVAFPLCQQTFLFLHLCLPHIDCSIRAAAAGSRVCLRQSVPVWVWPLGEPGYAPMTSHGHSAGWHVTHMHSVSDTHWERHGQADHQLLYRGKWNALNLIASIMRAVTARDQLCEGFHPSCWCVVTSPGCCVQLLDTVSFVFVTIIRFSFKDEMSSIHFELAVCSQPYSDQISCCNFAVHKNSINFCLFGSFTITLWLLLTAKMPLWPLSAINVDHALTALMASIMTLVSGYFPITLVS